MGSHATVRSWRISSKVQAKHPKLVICHGNQRIHNISKQKLQARWSLGLSLMNLQFSYLFYLILMLDLELYIPMSELDFQLQLWFWFCVPLRRSRKKRASWTCGRWKDLIGHYLSATSVAAALVADQVHEACLRRRLLQTPYFPKKRWDVKITGWYKLMANAAGKPYWFIFPWEWDVDDIAREKRQSWVL